LSKSICSNPVEMKIRLWNKKVERSYHHQSDHHHHHHMVLMSCYENEEENNDDNEYRIRSNILYLKLLVQFKLIKPGLSNTTSTTRSTRLGRDSFRD
jgi:hypothetical protein